MLQLRWWFRATTGPTEFGAQRPPTALILRAILIRLFRDHVSDPSILLAVLKIRYCC
jgi:hypothetical protein